MAEITTGIRAVLSHPRVYNAVQRVLGAERARRILAREYLPDLKGRRLLDIGCGTAEMLRHLPDDARYYGFDASEAYIRFARLRFDSRGEFRAELVREAVLSDLPPFDCVLAFGLLHHLDDDEARALFRLAANSLTEDGMLVTVDPAYVPEQSGVARWLISRDRGRNVRDPEAYAALARNAGFRVDMDVRHDMLHVPYTHAILRCRLA